MTADAPEAGGGKPRGRNTISVALAVLGGLVLLVGTVALYARSEIIDEQAFADHAAEALEDDAVRQLVSEQIVVQVAERGSADLIAARPLLETVVDAALDTQPFRQAFREAARQTNRLLFVREKTASPSASRTSSRWSASASSPSPPRSPTSCPRTSTSPC